jgi:hypothetical protein
MEKRRAEEPLDPGTPSKKSRSSWEDSIPGSPLNSGFLTPHQNNDSSTPLPAYIRNGYLSPTPRSWTAGEESPASAQSPQDRRIDSKGQNEDANKDTEPMDLCPSVQETREIAARRTAQELCGVGGMAGEVSTTMTSLPIPQDPLSPVVGIRSVMDEDADMIDATSSEKESFWVDTPDNNQVLARGGNGDETGVRAPGSPESADPTFSHKRDDMREAEEAYDTCFGLVSKEDRIIKCPTQV